MLQFTLFDPQKNIVKDLPAQEGNYLFVLKKGCSLPLCKIGIKPVYTTYDGLQVIYTGISENLQKRDWSTHLNGIAGRSTLRKSLGVLFGYTLVPRDKHKITNKTTLLKDDEDKLSVWMKDNLLFYYCANNDSKNNEQKLIDEYNPPLNIQKTTHLAGNSEFRKCLSELRSSKNVVR